MKILKKYNKVKELLEQKEIYRDDYYPLLARLWHDEMPDKKISAFDFLHNLRAGKVTHPESIMRLRRKIQEEHPHLRGKTYRSRQITQTSVRQELGYAR